MAKVLIGCEFSGVVRDAFRAEGHDAWSCDFLPCEGDNKYHLQGDVRLYLNQDWRLFIVHPTCTYLCNSGVRWLYGGKGRKRDPFRWDSMKEAAEFFKEMQDVDIPHIAVENPIMHQYGREIIGSGPSQIIQPWMFGHKEMKATCLWLTNLPLLVPTKVVGPPPKDPEQRKKWAKVHLASPGPNRWRERSRTLKGIGRAMATQWGKFIE